MSSQAQFKFACPQCGQHLEAERDMIGMEFSCPSCGKPIVVPPAHFATQYETPKHERTLPTKDDPLETRGYIIEAKLNNAATGIRNASTPLVHRLVSKWPAFVIPQWRRVGIVAASVVGAFILLSYLTHHAKKNGRQTTHTNKDDMENIVRDIESGISTINEEREKGGYLTKEEQNYDRDKLCKDDKDVHHTRFAEVETERRGGGRNITSAINDKSASLAYCVIDLSAGSSALSYPVTYMAEPPSGGFNVDEYKTTKLVLKLIKSGSYKMQNSTIVTLTNPFYIGIFEVTQKQYSLIMGSNFSSFPGDKRPVENVKYDMVRGSSKGAMWPMSDAVDPSSFIGKLRARTGLAFDLPTEAQWEYACRAGTTTLYSYGDNVDDNYMWYYSTSYGNTHEVGTKSPNPWGLYDMHGNVWEWCLDWYGKSLSYGTDPVGSSSGTDRVIRGGSWQDSATKYCTSSFRGVHYPFIGDNFNGFRLRLGHTPSLAEKPKVTKTLTNEEAKDDNQKPWITDSPILTFRNYEEVLKKYPQRKETYEQVNMAQLAYSPADYVGRRFVFDGCSVRQLFESADIMNHKSALAGYVAFEITPLTGGKTYTAYSDNIVFICRKDFFKQWLPRIKGENYEWSYCLVSGTVQMYKGYRGKPFYGFVVDEFAIFQDSLGYIRSEEDIFCENPISDKNSPELKSFIAIEARNAMEIRSEKGHYK